MTPETNDAEVFDRVMMHMGIDGCGGAAFYVNRNAQAGEAVKAEDAQLLDGTRPERESGIVCGTCGNRMALDDFDSTYLRPRTT